MSQTDATSGDPIAKIAGEILQLSNDRFLKATALLEQVKGHPSSRRALETARPRLIELRPPRRMDLQRLFYLPIEDLLVDHVPEAAREGRIDRALMLRCWTLLQESADKIELQRLGTAVSGLTSIEWEKLKNAGERLWVLTAATIGKAVARAKSDSAFATALFGDAEAVGIAGDLAEAFRIAGEVVALKARFPEKPVVAFDDEDYGALIGVMRRIREGQMGEPWQLVWVMSARMANPIGFLIQFLKQRGFEPPPSAGLMVDRSVTRLEAQVKRAHAATGSAAHTSEVAAQAVHMASTLASAKQLARMRKHLAEQVGRIGHELHAMVRDVVVEGAVESVMATLPRSGDLAIAPNFKEIAQAEDRVLALCQVSGADPSINLGPAVQEKLKIIAQAVEHQIREALDQLGIQPATAEARKAAQAHLSHSVRLVELAEGPAAAERIMMHGHSRITAAFGKG